MSLWVVKIGTSLLRGTEEFSTVEMINNICISIAESKSRGDQIILVSSGAVGLGCIRLGLKSRPSDLFGLQAAAAIGQGHLMSLYETSMGKYGYNVAQVLLTRSDLSSRDSYRNASMTLKQLLNWGVLPIVNENDTISSEELKYGDNDTLSALVATLIGADQLILLTDVDRLYSKDPRKDSNAQPITDVHHLNELNSLKAKSSEKGKWGTGGIKTKLSAAHIATESGITVHLADGRSPEILGDLLKGSRGGTVFHPHPKPLGNRKSWLAHAIDPIGNIFLDIGASEAIQNHGASLLLVGVKHIEGNFTSNQPVRILDNDGNEIAKGISSFSSEDLRNALRKTIDVKRSPIVVHRDVLVLTAVNVS